jgi:hypothetical protein
MPLPSRSPSPLPCLFAAVLALVACLGPGPSGAATQTPAGPTKTPAGTVEKAIMHPMVFYLAHGEANACGPGCSEWIIADGKIDAGAAYRFQALLWKLNGSRPPLFLNSPGGLINVSIQIGRMIREHNLTVSVGRTIALNCGPAGKPKTCGALIGAGERLEARLDPESAMCNSACVYVMAGGSVRLIPPWVALGIHNGGFEPSTGFFRPSQLAMTISKELADAHLQTYMREMGIDTRLLTEAFAVPFTSMARLSREDAARFGLDRRDFGETVWEFYEKPMPAVRKSFFVRTGQGRYVNGMAAVFCARGDDGSRIMIFGREHLSADTADIAGQPPVDANVNGQSFAFRRVPNAALYVHQGTLSASAFASAADKAALALPAAEFGRQQGPSGDVKLSMFGFAQAHARLQKACTQAATVAMTGPLAPSASGLIPRSVLQTMQSANALPALSSQPLGAGASRAQVDAALGTPTKTIGSVSLYSYVSSSNERKVMAGYFDKAGDAGHLHHFARFVLKDDKILDEISEAELTQGQELPAVRSLLALPVTAGGSTAPAPTAH